MFNRASASIEQGDYTDGVSLLRRILDEHPETPTAGHVRSDWSYYEELLRIEAARLPNLATRDLRSLGHAIEAHRDRHGRYPEVLPAAGQPSRDPWGRAYRYRREGTGYVVETLGRDGERGGAGEDRDFRVRNGILRPSLLALR